MNNVLQKIRQEYRNWSAGIVTRIDDREAPENSLADLIGFNISQKIGRLVKDSGTTAYFSSSPLPTGITSIYGIASFTVPRTNMEYVVIFGTKVQGVPKFWMRGRNLLTGADDASWLELTESEYDPFGTPPVISVDGGASSFGVINLLVNSSNYYKGWVVYNTTRNQWAYITADSYSVGVHTITIKESYSAWAVNDILAFYRYPDTAKLQIDDGDVGDDIHFFANKLQDRLDIGWQRNVPIAEEPLCIEYIKRGIFYSSAAAGHAITLDEIYFGREIPNYENIQDAGVEILPNFSATSTYAPSADRLTIGWSKTGAGGNFYDRVDETVDATNAPNDSDHLYQTVLDSSSSILVEGTTLRLDYPTLSMPDKGTIRVNFRVKAESDAGYPSDWSPSIILGLSKQDGTILDYREVVLQRNATWVNFDVVIDVVAKSLNGLSLDSYIFVKPKIRPKNALNRTTSGKTTFRFSWTSVQIVNTGTVATLPIRLAFVPLYNGYMVGRVYVYTYQIPATGATYYPTVKVDMAKFDRRITDVFIFSDDGDNTLVVSEFNSAWQVAIASPDGKSKRGVPYGLIADWTYDSNFNVFKIAASGSSADTPEALATGRDKSLLQTLGDFVGYPIAKDPPSVGVRWRYQVQSSFRQNAQVFVDEGDDVLRVSNYSGTIHNDHTFVDVKEDNSAQPLKIFLTSKGELYGILGQLGKVYVFKQSAIEVIDAGTARSNLYEADVVAKKSIIFTSLGIVFAGKSSISVIPIHGGLRTQISDAIADEYIAIPLAYKENIVAAECKERGVIMFTVQTAGTVNTGGDYDTETVAYTTYFYHVEMKIWWKRVFWYTPIHYTQLSDNSVLYVSRETPKLLYYPSSAMTEDSSDATPKGVPWKIETQWLMGSDFSKILRTVMLNISSTVSTILYQIEVYFDRSSTPFDTLYGQTSSSVTETPLVVKQPNQWKEVKFIIRKSDTTLDLTASADLQVLGMTVYGETLVTGREE